MYGKDRVLFNMMFEKPTQMILLQNVVVRLDRRYDPARAKCVDMEK